jgi:DNA repair protein SbcC/Rad50
MIKSIRIRNFQSHKNTFLEFDKGVNVIVGPSDSGKTAIIRALRWLVWNKPMGSAFRSNWNGTTKVIAEFESGDKIIREKDKSDTYYFNDLEFKAFGSSTPEDIAKALNMSEVNLQLQLDTPFLLSDTPGQVAAYFNKIAGIDKIDLANKNVKKEITNTKQSISNFNEMLEINKEELKQYDILDTAEYELIELEARERQRIGLVRRIKTLFALISDYTIVEEYIVKQNNFIKVEKVITILINKFKELKIKKDNIFNFETLILKINKNDERIKQTQKYLNFEEIINPIFELINNRDKLNSKIVLFKNDILRITNLDNKLSILENDLNKLVELFNEQEIEICPFCGTKLK